MVPWSESCTTLFESVSRVTGFDLAAFHLYRQLREKGLYKQALRALTVFMRNLGELDEVTLRALTDGLCHIAWSRRDVDEELLPAILVNTVFVPCFERWRREEPHAVAPRRWLGVHCWDGDALEEARRLDRDENIARQVIAERLIEQIDFLQREMPGADMGSMRLVHRWAFQARKAAREIHHHPRRDMLLQRISAAVHLVETWTDMLVASRHRETPLFAPERSYERN